MSPYCPKDVAHAEANSRTFHHSSFILEHPYYSSVYYIGFKG